MACDAGCQTQTGAPPRGFALLVASATAMPSSPGVTTTIGVPRSPVC